MRAAVCVGPAYPVPEGHIVKWQEWDRYTIGKVPYLRFSLRMTESPIPQQVVGDPDYDKRAFYSAETMEGDVVTIPFRTYALACRADDPKLVAKLERLVAAGDVPQKAEGAVVAYLGDG